VPVWEEGYTFNFKLIEKDKAPPGKIFTPPSALAIAMIPPLVGALKRMATVYIDHAPLGRKQATSRGPD